MGAAAAESAHDARSTGVPSRAQPLGLAMLVLVGCMAAVAAQEFDPSAFGTGAAADTFNPSADPLGDVDTYRQLAQADLEGQWSKDDGRNATEKMQECISWLGAGPETDIVCLSEVGGFRQGLGNHLLREPRLETCIPFNCLHQLVRAHNSGSTC